MSYSRQAARLLRPSTRTRRRISAQFSMSMYTHRPHGGRTWMGVSETSIVVPRPWGRPWALRFLADRRPPARATFSHPPPHHTHRKKGRVAAAKPRLVFGSEDQLEEALAESCASYVVDSSFVDRQNTTDRHRNARKGRKTFR